MPSSETPQQSAQQLLLAQALASTANAIFITDQAGIIVWINDAFTLLSGYTAEDAIGSNPSILQSGKQTKAFYDRLWRTILAGNVWQGEVVDQRKDGSLYTVDEIITPLFNREGVITHFIAIQHDVTQRKQETERERHLAYHDVLTGLPNRLNFFDTHRQAISHARQTGNLVATLFVDLDNFKPVNDTFGHHIGDQLLVAIGERLRAAVRQTDLVARFGGDEFAVLLTNLPNQEIAATLAQKLLDTLSRPFMLSGQQVNISASIGIAIFPTDGDNLETLLINADKAMYQAKCQGGNSYYLHGTGLFEAPAAESRTPPSQSTPEREPAAMEQQAEPLHNG